MGIRNLNRYLHENCTKAITQHSLRDFAGKRVVIDTSIYLYRFVGENALIPQLYTMISILLSNRIIPFFVFDGKAPPEKRELLRRRRLEKEDAKEKYEFLSNKIKSGDIHPDEMATIQREMDILNRKMTKVTEEHIQQAKDLMDACGVQWIVADCESDQVCAYMVRSKAAWACISDDMDMFVLGCTRVFRNLHLTNQTVLYYSLPSILREIGVSMVEFRQIAVISGTDYNIDQMDSNTTNLTETLRWFQEYRHAKKYTNMNFYDWLLKYTKYIKNMENLKHIYSMFDISETDECLFKYSDLRIQLKFANLHNICTILNENGMVIV
jgi:flap endonuclease-1